MIILRRKIHTNWQISSKTSITIFITTPLKVDASTKNDYYTVERDIKFSYTHFSALCNARYRTKRVTIRWVDKQNAMVVSLTL